MEFWPNMRPGVDGLFISRDIFSIIHRSALGLVQLKLRPSIVAVVTLVTLPEDRYNPLSYRLATCFRGGLVVGGQKLIGIGCVWRAR